jgi:hypothetical protein
MGGVKPWLNSYLCFGAIKHPKIALTERHPTPGLSSHDPFGPKNRERSRPACAAECGIRLCCIEHLEKMEKGDE